MGVNNTTQNNDAYGLTQPTINVFLAPIISNRAPTTSDLARLGRIWVNKSTQIIYCLALVSAGAATWIVISQGGSGTFTSLTVSGNITSTGGNISATVGSVSAGTTLSAGTTVTAGTGITATTGNIVASTGNITSTLGSVGAATTVTAGTTMTAGTGITATTGNIVASTGNINSTAGSMSAATTITAGTGITASAGNITATAGIVQGTVLRATGDLAGLAATTQFTSVVDTAQSTGALSILSDSANPGNNAGFLKIYVGTAVAYVPYFTVIAP